MERRHEDQLNNALDQLYLEGATSIRWDQLYVWFNAERLGKTAYRDLIRRWEELCTSTYGYPSAPELLVHYRHDKPTLTLIRKPIDNKEKIQLLSKWA